MTEKEKERYRREREKRKDTHDRTSSGGVERDEIKIN